MWTTPFPPEQWTASPITNPGAPVTWKSSSTRTKKSHQGDRELLRSVQKQLKVKIRDKKTLYTRKLESNVWNVQDEDHRWSLDRANELNSFFNRFSSETSCQLSHLPPQSWILLLLHYCFQLYQVKRHLGRLNRSKAAGPESWTPVQISCVGFFILSSTSAWCVACSVWCLKIHHSSRFTAL